MAMFTIRWITALALCTLVAACGGHSSHSTSSSSASSSSSSSSISSSSSSSSVSSSSSSSVSSSSSSSSSASSSLGGAPYGVSIDSSNTIFVSVMPNIAVLNSADQYAGVIQQVSMSGAVTTLAGSLTQGFINATGSAARFNGVQGIAQDSNGNVYVAESINNVIRKITPAGVVTTFAGTGALGETNGPGTSATFKGPRGLAIDGNGNLYVAELVGCSIRKIDAAGTVSTLAGDGTCGSTDGPAASAQFDEPEGLAVDAAGNVYVADSNNGTIRKITAAGVVSTFAGKQGIGGLVDGTGSAARFSVPYGVAVDGSGNVYIADYSNDAIRKITPAGVVSTLAGGAGSGSVDGNGTAAKFSGPFGVAVDVSGNVYVADGGNHAIRVISPAGTVTTLVR